MASVFCMQCGTSNVPGASYCISCGAPLGIGASSPGGGAPLPSSSASAPTAPWFPPPSPPRPRRRRWLWVGVGLVVVILVFGGVAFLFSGPTDDIQVTGINFSSPDNACGVAGATDSGFNATDGTQFQLTYQIFNNATSTCTIASVSTSTAGFNISGANVPLSIPANASQLLSFAVDLPSQPYTGVLTLVIT